MTVGTQTYIEGIEHSIRNADPATTPHTIQDGYNILRYRLDEHAAQDFARTARRLNNHGFTEADSVAAHWWAYA